MELWGPRAPPPLLPLLLLLGVGLLPGKFLNAERFFYYYFFPPGSWHLGLRGQERGGPGLRCQAAGARNGIARDSSTHYSSDVLRC